MTKPRFLRLLCHARLCSPSGLLLRALVLAALFALLHLCGARECTRVFSGTSPDLLSLFLGVSYAVFYLGTVVVVPILLIAALLLFLLQLVRWRGAQR